MSGATYFVQECPTCGRQLEVRLEYLGRTLQCQPCHGQFETDSHSRHGVAIANPESSLLDRAEQLLSSTAASRPRLH